MALNVWCLLILAFINSGGCQTLTESGSDVINPGDSHKLTCTYSGISDSSADISWVRQAPGKRLEWVSFISAPSGSNKYYSQAVQGRFTISRDNSKHQVYLHMTSLESEDSAIYYCVRSTGGVGVFYFDYWGKGTKVTVTSGVQSPPKSIFGLLPCGPSSGGFYTIGCMTSGFSPADSVNFKWTDGSGTALSDIVQYPAVQKDGAYTKISHVNVKAQDWKDRKPFKCVAEGAGVIKETILEPATVHKQSASLYLTNPSETELAKGTATYVCLAKDFSPKEHLFKWLKDNEEVTDKKYIFSTSIKEEKNGMHTLYTATSVLQLDSSAWSYPATPTVRCEFKQQDKTLFKEAKSSTVHCACEPKIEIIPPTAEDMLKEKAGSLKCVVSGCPVMVDKITWKSGEDVRVSDTTHGQDSTISTTHISYEDWNALTFTCEVHHKGFVNPESLTYRRENGGEYRCPSVYLLPPPEQTNGKVTLICYVKHFFPREVVVSWLVNDEPVDKTQEYEQKTTNVLQSKGLFSVYGQLTFDTSLWEKGNVYTCQVYHETGETVSITTRTIDKSSQKSALNMPKICKDSGN